MPDKPNTVAADSRGNTFFAGSLLWRVRPDGTIVQFSSGVFALTTDSADVLYGVDPTRGTLKRYADDGMASLIAQTSGFYSASGLSTDKNDNIYINGSSIRRVSPSEDVETLETGVADPGDLAVDGSDNLYVIDRLTRGVQKRAPNGLVTTAMPGPVLIPGDELLGLRSIAVDSNGMIYIGDSLSHVIVRTHLP